MSEAEFWDSTPRYFAARVKAFVENRQGMEEARFVAYYVMKTVDPKNRYKRLTQIVKFPWEKALRTVKLEDWDSPEMLKFDEEADKALAILNPEAYAQYMEGKRQRELAAVTPLAPLEGGHEDPDFSLSCELDF